MLNAYQKNAIEVEMTLLEATLRDLKRLVREPPEDGLLTRVLLIPDGHRARIEKAVDAMLEEVGLVVREFDLQPQDESIGRRIDAQMAGAWSDLHEVLSAKLRRYGDIDPHLSRKLDPHIKRMIRLTLEVGRLTHMD